jgi:serine/threonine protein kinase
VGSPDGFFFSPASPRALNPDVPKDLSAVVEACLEKRPADRFQSAEELCECVSAADGSFLFTHSFARFN